MIKLIIASNNKDKLREFRELTADMDVELLSQSEAGLTLDVEETGTSFEENAYLKAKAVTDATGCIAVADDSGICVDALNGAPGIYSARFGPGHEASGEERNEYLLEKLRGVTKRGAHYVCCICCTLPNGETISSRGECFGEIMEAPRGHGGFGYDPLFKPLDADRGMAELTPDEKNAISHRGKAMRDFLRQFKEYLDADNK